MNIAVMFGRLLCSDCFSSTGEYDVARMTWDDPERVLRFSSLGRLTLVGTWYPLNDYFRRK